MTSANIANTYVVPDSTKVTPFYDDFDESKNFNRILFRPGYAVQARELTQLQTILQNQIERFGRSIYENGSPVIGGDVYYPPESFSVINLAATYANTEIVAANFKDKTIVFGNGDSNVSFRVIQTSEASQNTAPALYGKYLSNYEFGPGTTIKVNDEQVYANIANTNANGTCEMAFIRDSVFFVDGYFVKVPSQSVVLVVGDIRPNIRIGLEIQDDIITEEEDTTLLDPAQEASNFQAPGAARYKLSLTLATRPLNSADDSKFIELLALSAGEILRQVKFPIYSEIEKTLARRTYDQSGNFTVKPFVISFDLDRYDPFNFVKVSLSPGKAYIYGHEFETPSDTIIRLPKARTKNSVLDYNLNLNYGNYVIVDNLNGVFDISTSALVDIHCVPQANIEFTSNATYQTTKIGTCRVRDIEFYGGDIDVTARRFEFYIYDTNFRDIRSNVATATSNSITLFNGTTLLSNVANAYTGASVNFLEGPGAGESFKVSYYDSSSKTLYLESNLISTPTANTIAALRFDFGLSESFVINGNYTSGATSYANADITVLNKANNSPSGLVFISEPSLNTLLFPLPDSWVANGITDMTYSYHKKYASITFTDGVSDPILADLNEDFLGATSSSNTSLTAMDNFLVICTNAGSSGRSNNDMIKVATSVTPGAGPTPGQAILTSKTENAAGDTFTATVFAKMEYNPGVFPKLKNFVQANTSTLSFETPAVITGPTGSTANVYLNAAQTVIVNPSRKVGVSESLYVSDVIGIDKIYDLNGAEMVSAGDLFNQFIDVTDRYDFDNGQRTSHYDHASIKLKPNYPPCVGPLIVCYHYYTHTVVSGGGGYFSVDSYPNLNTTITNNGENLGYGYAIIPQFIKSNGDVVELRDCIDFRPARQNGVGTFPDYPFTGLQTPVPTTDFLLNYEYYLGRRDLIVLTDNKTINRVEGIPSKFPQDPTVPNKSMVLYSLGIPPYTEYPANVTSKYVDNKRYTMRDIGKIEKRVETLEYYVSLNNLEKKAMDMTITDVNGLARTKYGIFSDSFVGHALGATNLDDYKCAMNFNEGYLQCESTTTGIPLSVVQNLSTGVKIYRDKILLNSGNTTYISQPYATKDAPVSEFLYAVFEGNIFTLPEADIWKDTKTDPTIVITDSNQIETTRINVYQTIVNSQAR